MQCSSLSLFTVFVLKSILSDIYIATPTFFLFPFAWHVFCHPFTLSLCVSLDLKWVSCRHRIYESWFFFSIRPHYIFWLEHLVHLYLKYFWQVRTYCHFVNCFLVVFVVLCSFLLLFSSLVIWCLSLVLSLYSFLLSFFVYLHRFLVWSWQLLKFVCILKALLF